MTNLRILFVLVLTATTALAQETCPGYDVNDPYSVNVRFTEGPNKGQCMNFATHRPIHILNEQEMAPYRPEAGEILVANFFHKKTYWIARFPKDFVAKAIAQKEYFDPGSKTGALLNRATGFSAHLQNRFRAKKGLYVLLYPQVGGSIQPQHKIRNVIFSAEAVLPADDGSFDIFRGAENRFGIAMRVTSLEEKIMDMVVDQGHHVDQMPLKPLLNKQLDPPDTSDTVLQKYFRAFLQDSNSDFNAIRAGKPPMYSTMGLNCVSKGKNPYDRVNHDVYNQLQKKMSDEGLKFNPMLIEKGFKYRGMLQSVLGILAPNYMLSLEAEYKKSRSLDP